jgi:hypothetical protein
MKERGDSNRIGPPRSGAFLRLTNRIANLLAFSGRRTPGASTLGGVAALKHVTVRCWIALTESGTTFADSDSAALAVSCRLAASAAPGCRDHVDVVAGQRRRNPRTARRGTGG